MTKITTDFVGTESAAVTKQRITEILDYWGYDPNTYTTWGNARTDLNALLSGTALGTIAATELAGTFLPKLNLLNTPDELMQELLFANDEPGFFIDADDWDTLFQDTAGTTPVTAPNQGVALALDKSGRGNHATQAVTAARPLTAVHPDGGVRNLLDRTEDFGAAVWSKEGVTVSGDVITFPAAVTFNPSAGGERLLQTVNVGERNGRTFTHTWVIPPASAWSDPTASLKIGSSITGAGGPVITATDSEQTISFTETYESSGSSIAAAIKSNKILSISGLKAQIIEGAIPTPYQRRVNFLNVTEAGKESIRRLYFNGTSHFMQTPTITPNTDKVQVFAGVRKLSDAARATIVQGPDLVNYTLALDAPRTNGSTDYAFVNLMTAVQSATASGAAPNSSVIAAIGDFDTPTLANPLTLIRRNGVIAESNSGSLGATAGNYKAGVYTIGCREGTSQFFNGYIDQLITRFGPNLDTATIEKTEKYVSTKSPEVEL